MCLVGVIVRRYIDFLKLLIPTPLVSALFYSSIPTFCSFLMFFIRRRIRRRRKKKNQITILYFEWCVSNLHYYSDVIHWFDWKSAVEHDGGVYVPSVRYSSICNVLRLWRISLISTYSKNEIFLLSITIHCIKNTSHLNPLMTISGFRERERDE